MTVVGDISGDVVGRRSRFVRDPMRQPSRTYSGQQPVERYSTSRTHRSVESRASERAAARACLSLVLLSSLPLFLPTLPAPRLSISLPLPVPVPARPLRPRSCVPPLRRPPVLLCSHLTYAAASPAIPSSLLASPCLASPPLPPNPSSCGLSSRRTQR